MYFHSNPRNYNQLTSYLDFLYCGQDNLDIDWFIFKLKKFLFFFLNLLACCVLMECLLVYLVLNQPVCVLRVRY